MISGTIIGAGRRPTFSEVRWGVAGHRDRVGPDVSRGRSPGALVYGLATAFGSGATGPLLIAVALFGAFALVIVRRAQPAAPAPGSPAAAPS